MIFFEDWSLRADGQVIAQQFDNLTRTLVVQGEVPDDWEWTMLVQVGEAMDILPLAVMQEGLGVVLTAGQLSISGYYKMQLRATRGELVRHTNTIHVYIPASLTGDEQWPAVPSEFTDLERRATEAVHKAEKAAVEAENGAEQAAAAENNVEQAKAAAQHAATAAGQSAANASASERAAAEHRTRAEQGAMLAESYTSHPPIVGENGNWWGWDGAQYVDSGKLSQGEQGIQGERGPQGEQGVQGERGPQGEPGELTARQGNTRYANALKGAANGVAIRVDDVSPLEHTIPVEVSSKNIIPYPYVSGSATYYGVTYTVNTDGSVTINGTSTTPFNTFELWKNTGTGPCPFKDGVTYILSGCDPEKLDGVGIYTSYLDETGATKYFYPGATLTWSNKYTIKTIYIQLANSVGKTFENITVYPQIEVGTAATEYVPYIDPTTVTVKVLGKNVIPRPYSNGTGTNYYGVIFTVNEDGSVTMNGTATLPTTLFNLWKNTGAVPCPFKDGVTYVSSGSKDNVNLYISYRDETGTTKYFGSYPSSFMWSNAYTLLAIYIQFMGEGETFENVTIYPQIEVGTTATEYEPYRCAEYTSAEDGTCEVTSLAPTMTLTTDSPNVILDCKYNRDINKAFEQLTQAIISMGGNV